MNLLQMSADLFTFAIKIVFKEEKRK